MEATLPVCRRCRHVIRAALEPGGSAVWVHEDSGIESCDAAELGRQLSLHWLDPLGMFLGRNRRAA